LFSIPVGLQGSVLPIFWPAFTQAWQRRDLRWLRRVLPLVCVLSVAAMVCFGIGAVALGGWFLEVWTRGRVSVPRSLLLGLALWLACQSAIYWLSTFLHSIGDFRFELLVYFLSALILLVLGPPLLGRLGLTGLAVAMTLALAVGSLVPMILRVRQKLDEQ
jgi:O-antigen/teichoic acid export membrane protein